MRGRDDKTARRATVELDPPKANWQRQEAETESRDKQRREKDEPRDRGGGRRGGGRQECQSTWDCRTTSQEVSRRLDGPD